MMDYCITRTVFTENVSIYRVLDVKAPVISLLVPLIVVFYEH